ncbi:MAG: hypothetical protein ACRCYY_13265 [Trueperaceae bacterium]
MASILTQPSIKTQTRLEPNRFRLLAGIPVLFGVFLSLMGLAWDINWHDDVGPDTFFTLPHTFLYGGVAIAGLACLYVVLRSTLSYQRGQRIFPKEQLTYIWPVFRAPLGFIIAGFGAAMFLTYGAYDEIWHRTFGFDVTLVSPPHQGLLLSVVVSMIGAISIFAGAKNTEHRLTGKMLGVSAGIAILFSFLPFILVVIQEIVPYQNAFQLSIAATCTLGLLMASSITKRVGTATLVALFATLIRTVAWYFAPWATQVYADSLGLFIRDYSDGIPGFAATLPTYILVAGIVIDAVLFIFKRTNFSLKTAVVISGSLASLLIVLPFNFYRLEWQDFLLPSVPIALALGALFGWIGWKLGAIMNASKTSLSQTSISQ